MSGNTLPTGTSDRSVSIGTITCVVLLIVVTAFTYRDITSFRSEGNWAALTQAAQGILEGKPHWRAFQNRLLGPLLVNLLSSVTADFTVALKLFTLLGIAAQNVLLYALLRTVEVSKTQSLLWVVCWAFLFASLQNTWLYTWDFLDILVFTFFSYSLFFNRWIGASFLLYFVAIVNRESAIFIACGLILLQIFENWKAGPFTLLSNKRIWLYATAAILGAVYTKLIRDWMFIESIFGGEDLDHKAFGNHFNLSANLRDMFYNNVLDFNVVHTVPVLLACAGAVLLLFKSTDTGMKAGAAVFLLFFANIMAFGILNETRMLFPLFSFVIFAIVRYQQMTGAGDMKIVYRVVTASKPPD